jgi:CheY-like chemotaxis protein
VRGWRKQARISQPMRNRRFDGRNFLPLPTRLRLMRYGCMMASKPPVLVVEDEMFIRMIAVDTLEDRGYGILEAGDAREALAVLEQTPGIALIFTDVNMPGDIDGLDLATEVAKRWPHIEIIVTSGALRLDDVDSLICPPILSAWSKNSLHAITASKRGRHCSPNSGGTCFKPYLQLSRKRTVYSPLQPKNF